MPSVSPVLPEAQMLYYGPGHSPTWPSAWPAAWHTSFLKGDKNFFVATVDHYNNVHWMGPFNRLVFSLNKVVYFKRVQKLCTVAVAFGC